MRREGRCRKKEPGGKDAVLPRRSEIQYGWTTQDGEMRLDRQSQITNNLRTKVKIFISSRESQKPMKTSKGQK